MNQEKNISFVKHLWDESIIPTLMEYIKIPNKSPDFDPDWRSHGYMQQAVELISTWMNKHAVEGMKLEIIQLEERTPLILVEIPGNVDNTILLYGHLDKQPEMTGWDEGLHPWKPVLRGDNLYGRGSADDGYAAFASLAAIRSLKDQNSPHGRCIILIEACEESGSSDLPFYIEKLKTKIGKPELVVCLDSGCGNYEQLWLTNSLRGVITATLKINVLKDGIHSGNGSGIVPSCFRILRQLLDRVENKLTGEIILEAFHVPIPKEREQQANKVAQVLGDYIHTSLPFLAGVQPESTSLLDLVLRNTWQPTLSIVGCEGMPELKNAGNVVLPSLAVKLSMRLPPTCDPEQAAQVLKRTLEENPPYQAKVTCEMTENSGAGWNAPIEKEWLNQAAQTASLAYFGKDAVHMGEGGSIPFMGMLGRQFPDAQFLITGVLGPGSNAHGPNEFLHIPTGKKLTACVAHVIAAHYKHCVQQTMASQQ